MEKKDVRILIVDDEPTMADSLKQNLVEEGYAVDTAATGAEAIEFLIRVVITWRFVICNCRISAGSRSCVTSKTRDHDGSNVVTGHGSVAKAVEATKAGLLISLINLSTSKNFSSAWKTR